jgi:anionic cell wall polymer biosynthesis LytR-Cps2A-Psr (LCP) family protein
MKIVIGILDQAKNTDNIVLIDILEKTFTWIPRDLFSTYLHDRINIAFAKGGHSLFLQALQKLGFHADYSIIVWNEATRAIFNNYKITVPVERVVDYYYPIKALEPIENGKKIISFRPPFETLTGERIHQFLGARYRVNKADYIDLPDFERIARQMVFIKQMLIEKFDFSVFLDKKISISDQKAINFLTEVNSNYNFKMYRLCKSFKINRMDVLINTEKKHELYKVWLLKIYYFFIRAVKKTLIYLK